MSASATELLEQARVLLERVAMMPADDLTDEQLCAVIVSGESVGRLVDSVRVRAAAEVDDRSRFELGSAGLAFRLGHRRPAHLIEHLTRVSNAEAVKRMRIGAATRECRSLQGERIEPAFGAVAGALAHGAIGLDAALAVIRTLGQAIDRGAVTGDVCDAEQQLVDAAATDSADLIATMSRAWREALDPDGAAPRDEALRARRGFTLGRERDGMTPFNGACDPTSAALLKAAFAESLSPDASPRFLDESDREIDRGDDHGEGGLGDVLPDPRTPPQRRLDVLVGLLTAGLRSTGLRSTATVMAVVRLTDLENGSGIGHLDDVDEPISAASVQELACDAGFQRVTLGPAGEVLHLGRLERLFSSAQRKALAVRDGGCIWEHCTAPPSWCHAHHVISWSEGGATDIDNGVLLCPAHHHMLHNSEFTIVMINGRPHIRAPEWLDPLLQFRPLGRPRYSPAA